MKKIKKRNKVIFKFLIILLGTGSFLYFYFFFFQANAFSSIVSVKVKSLSQTPQYNLPLTISQVFKKGEAFTQAIGVEINGEKIDSQTTILRHWEDGSIKHALISLVLPKINPKEELSLNLYPEAQSPEGSVLTLDSLLSTDFDAKLKFIFEDSSSAAISARDLILAKNWKVRYQGPISSEFILYKVFQDLYIEFVVRVFKGVKGARVSVIVENNFVELDKAIRRGYGIPKKNGDLKYTVEIYLSHKNPKLVYKKENLIHYYGARWRKVFWWGREKPEVQIKPDISYLISTKVLPDYDLSIEVSEKTINYFYNKWQKSNHDILGNGIITPYMPQTGERGDIGPYPSWAVLYLFTQDPKIEEVLINTGELGGSFSAHGKNRETLRIFTIEDDPQVTGVDGAYGHHNLKYSKATPYTPDTAHQPSLAFIPYLITGDKYFLDEMFYWANGCLTWHNPAYRGYEKGLIHTDQVRGQAWCLRQLVDASAFAPDNSFEKRYFDEKIKNNIENWIKIMIGPPPLNKFGWYGARPDRDRFYKGLIVAPWQIDFLIWSLDHAYRAGYERARIPRDFLMNFLIGRFTNAPDYDPMDGIAYKIEVTDEKGRHYQTWGEIWENTFGKYGRGHRKRESLIVDAYSYYARACLTIAVREKLPKAKEAYDFLSSQLGNEWRKRFLKWAFAEPKIEKPRPKIVVIKKVEKKRLKISEEITFTLIVKNIGEGMAKNVIVEDLLDKSLAFVETSEKNSNFKIEKNKLRWEIGDLSSGKLKEIVFRVKIK